MNVSHHPYRTYRTTVARREQLSPSFLRMTLTGPDLVHFGTAGLDQRIKLVLPLPDGSFTDVGQFDESVGMMEWYRRWRELPDEARNPIRTYTIRAVRPETREIDVDFVLHGTEGPASAWASAAGPGAPLVVIGPDARADETGGLEWNPGDAGSVLIAGDETAVPAICAIVESLPAHVTGSVYIEVPTEADALPLAAPEGVAVRWLARRSAAHGLRLSAAVHAWGETRVAETTTSAADAPTGTELADPNEDEVLWEVPEASVGSCYAWLAGEASTITALRRHLVRGLGIDRRSVAFMGYWRRGRAEAA
ncbi:siderophore-interacting protein [Microbacterium azadirachtae]|uniref:Vibriobactin utilization protein ViuB n=1 Tax=Microbacterium azadirachtae TaxID=582680 RepID=A0A0F0LJU3_9MICO|nr:siderophore-interacting protein [Microbacterium azadirachtae]KJL33403.1 Vibriobactin utilization protein ViuB [Microbacterium azadirachtae]